MQVEIKMGCSVVRIFKSLFVKGYKYFNEVMENKDMQYVLTTHFIWVFHYPFKFYSWRKSCDFSGHL